jgi:hypothetical protein
MKAGMRQLLAQAAQQTTSIFGKIEAPDVVKNTYGVLGGSGPGITGLISNVVVLITVVGALLAFFNILRGGLDVINSNGDSKKLADLGSRLSTTFLGLLIMVAAPLIASLVGFLLFGDGFALLKPQIFGPGSFN